MQNLPIQNLSWARHAISHVFLGAAFPILRVVRRIDEVYQLVRNLGHPAVIIQLLCVLSTKVQWLGLPWSDMGIWDSSLGH